MAMTEMALQSGTPEIPDKLYFKIGEVGELLGVEPFELPSGHCPNVSRPEALADILERIE